MPRRGVLPANTLEALLKSPQHLVRRAHTHVCVCAYVYVCVCVGVPVCVSVCVCVYIMYVYAYMHTNTRAHVNRLQAYHNVQPLPRAKKAASDKAITCVRKTGPSHAGKYKLLLMS